MALKSDRYLACALLNHRQNLLNRYREKWEVNMAHVRWDILNSEGSYEDRLKRTFTEAFYGNIEGYNKLTLYGWKPLVQDTNDEDLLCGWKLLKKMNDPEMMAFEQPEEVFERHGAIVICAHIPGVRKESIYVGVRGNRLTVEGERLMAADMILPQGFVNESCYRSFRRVFFIPDSARKRRIRARLKGDIIRIEIPHNR